MPFDITLAEKDKTGIGQAVPVSGPGAEIWTRISIAGLSSFEYPVRDAEYDHEFDPFGGQPSEHTLRHDGAVWVAFVRLPSGDMFGHSEIVVSVDYAHWGDAVSSKRYVSSDPTSKSYATHFGIAIFTRTPNLKLINKIVNADRRNKVHTHKVTIAGKTYETTVAP